MKAVRKLFLLALPLLILSLGSGCTDPNAIIDQSTSIENLNWSYANRVKEDVKIDDPAIPYNIFINLRVTGNYRYSNIFMLVRRNGPGLKAITRFELKLAEPDGKWLGTGSGNLYSFQVPIITNFKFPAKGTYHFEIEQNMRDNPLREVSDVGLRVEKATEK
jgi:gliding motility-associated lipoprotein GldH